MQDNGILDNPEDPRSCVCFLLSRAAQAAQKRLRTLLEPYGITPAQYLILECLWLNDGLSPKFLGELLKFDSATLTGLIDRMEKARLVHREKDPADRRAIRIKLTDKARELKSPLRKLRMQANDEILQAFSLDQRKALKGALVIVISEEEAIRSS